MKKNWRRYTAAATTGILTAGLLLTGCGSNESSSDAGETDSGKTTLNVWSTSDDINRFVEMFEADNPDIDVEVTIVPNEDYLAKLTPTLASGEDAPDVFTAESDYVKYVVELDYWDDLSSDPYNFDNSEKGLWDYVVDVGTDSEGTVKALSWQASPGGLIYRTDMAEQYLGVTSSEEMSELINSQEKMLQAAETLKQNGIAMFVSWEDLLNMEFSNRDTAWVEDGKLVFSENMQNFMDTAKEIYDQDYTLNTAPWDGEWIAAVNQDTAFSYVLPTWGYQYVVKANADATNGKWGLAETPNPYVKGGTWLGVYKDSEKKEDAWKFMEYVTCNPDVQTEYAKEYGEYMSVKSADEALAQEEGDAVLGGQNMYEFYNVQMEKDVDPLMTEYDGTINDAFLGATKAYVEGSLTKDEAVQQFKDEVASAYPDLTVE